MEFLQYTAGNDDDGRRLDRVIRIFLKDVPMSEIYKLLRKGLIRLNGKKADCGSRIKAGDIIQIAKSISENNANVLNVPSNENKYPKRDNSSKKNTENAPEIPYIEDVFKNEHIRIINKPYGMSVHGGGSSGTVSLEQLVKQQFSLENADRSDKSLSFRPGPLHRIDRHTTGIVVFSQSLEGAKVFSEIMQSHTLKKEYLAVLCGNLSEEEIWEDFISVSSENSSEDDSKNVKDGFHTVSITKTTDDEKGKKAFSKAIPLAHGIYEGFPITLARIEIETGRKHQIRIQSSHHGYPLLGDKAYKGKNPSSIKGHFLLHAWKMSFPKENTLGLPEVITATLPTNFQIFIKNHLSQYEFSNYNNI